MPDFQHPLVLWLLLPLAVGLVWRWFSRPAGIAISSAEHFQEKPARRFFTARHFLLFLEGLAAAGFIVALSRPQSDVEVAPIQREGTDIIICLDYSNSMDAYDPDQSLTIREVQEGIARGEIVDRLGVARQQIARFVKRRSGDRIGLVIFGVDDFLASPPTLDHDYVLGQVDQLNNSILFRHERGTNIAGGVAASVRALLSESQTRRTIVLITDGDHTVKDEVFTPTTAAQAARDKDIVIHTVGIGSVNPYRDGWLKNNTSAIIRFDTKTLEKIASVTGGRFFRAKDNQGFEEVMNTIDSLETTSRIHPALIFKRDLYPYLLIPGVLLLGLAAFLRKTFLLQLS